MILRTIPVGITSTNCYVVACEETHETVVIDPGGHPERILSVVDENDLKVKLIVNTHCHFDHMAANADIVAATGAPLALHPAELPILESRGGAAWFGVSVKESPPPDQELSHQDEITIGTLQFQVLHTPGHSPGSVTLYIKHESAAFDGDVLFAMGIGRTDLPGGDWDTLLSSIRDVLFSLPDETTLYPGHGPETTVGQERRSNPWVRA
jgi:glyoxylase-like metal-dependent hydrolase (beta-lactamase superfamily II)